MTVNDVEAAGDGIVIRIWRGSTRRPSSRFRAAKLSRPNIQALVSAAVCFGHGARLHIWVRRGQCRMHGPDERRV
jgi:hypothetical protein